MNFKKSQSGRSMVEMLGVLAIIGVLSVGGIAGYSLSMRRHRANQIVDYVAKHALMAYSLCQKKVLDGTATYGSNTISGCESNVLVPGVYETGYRILELGNLPAGATRLFHGHVEFNPTTKEESVATYVRFSDQKLCQAVASVIGSTCDYYLSTDKEFSLTIKIKQN